jgi:hypothetical protein
MKVTFLDVAGAQQQAMLPLNLYQAAHEAHMTVDSYLAQKYKTDPSKYGSTMNQMFASAGIFFSEDKTLGLKKTTVAEAVNGTCDTQFQVAGSANTADAVPASRILFPAALLQMVESQLYGNRQSEVALFDTFITDKQTVSNSRYWWPVLDYARPSQATSSRISQLAEPNLMMTLTASDKTGSIPTFSLGLVISDEAMQQNTLDFVALSMTRQAEIEAAARLDECVEAMINGDVDIGQAALPTNKVSAYDTSITTPGTITHLAWLQWLSSKRRIRQINVCLMTLATFIKLENRTGRPTKLEDASAQPFEQRPDIIPSLLNLSLSGVQVMIFDNNVIPDDLIVGFDTRYAMRKVTNAQAEYSAIERMVLQKGNSMRWDWGYTVHRLYDQAWDVLSLTV